MSPRPTVPDSPPVPDLTLNPPSGDVATIPEPVTEPGQGPDDTPRRKRKRRTKAQMVEAETPETAPQASPEDLARCQVALAAMFEIGGKIVAKRRGAHWLLDKEECDALGQAWTNALAPYLEKIGGALPFAAAAAITFGVLKPRLDLDAERAGEPASPPPLVQ